MIKYNGNFYKAELEDRTLFKTINKYVLVFEENNNIFYYNRKNSNFVFSLPKGKYTIYGKIALIDEKIDLPKFKLPEPEKNIPYKGLKIRIAYNPHKASINVKTGDVIIDPNFANKGFVTKFILLHEEGHYFYYTEEKCDLYAAIKMLNMGYNLSQVAIAISSFRNQDRINNLYKMLKEFSVKYENHFSMV